MLYWDRFLFRNHDLIQLGPDAAHGRYHDPGRARLDDRDPGLALHQGGARQGHAGAAGGVPYLSSLSAPYSHKGVQFVPTGGVNPDNLKEYLGLNTVMAVGGTWIAKSADINSGEWEKIKTNCRDANNFS